MTSVHCGCVLMSPTALLTHRCLGSASSSQVFCLAVQPADIPIAIYSTSCYLHHITATHMCTHAKHTQNCPSVPILTGILKKEKSFFYRHLLNDDIVICIAVKHTRIWPSLRQTVCSPTWLVVSSF